MFCVLTILQAKIIHFMLGRRLRLLIIVYPTTIKLLFDPEKRMQTSYTLWLLVRIRTNMLTLLSWYLIILDLNCTTFSKTCINQKMKKTPEVWSPTQNTRWIYNKATSWNRFKTRITGLQKIHCRENKDLLHYIWNYCIVNIWLAICCQENLYKYF